MSVPPIQLNATSQSKIRMSIDDLTYHSNSRRRSRQKPRIVTTTAKPALACILKDIRRVGSQVSGVDVVAVVVVIVVVAIKAVVAVVAVVAIKAVVAKITIAVAIAVKSIVAVIAIAIIPTIAAPINIRLRSSYNARHRAGGSKRGSTGCCSRCCPCGRGSRRSGGCEGWDV